jgi:leader peptidase (prepilin peptidase) / N-methyltransferase
MGFGDVKLGGVLGLGLGWFGLPHVLVGVVYAFVLGGLVSLALIVGRRATRRSAIAFGPFLVLGFLLAVLTGDNLVSWYLGR